MRHREEDRARDMNRTRARIITLLFRYPESVTRQQSGVDHPCGGLVVPAAPAPRPRTGVREREPMEQERLCEL